MMVYHAKILMDIMMEIILSRLDGYFNPYSIYFVINGKYQFNQQKMTIGLWTAMMNNRNDEFRLKPPAIWYTYWFSSIIQKETTESTTIGR